MSQGISFSGLGSGLDTDAIISQLMAVERRPVQLVQNRQFRLEEQKAIVQEINSSLLTLKGTVETLSSDELFSIVSARSDDEDLVSVSATNEAAGGTFSVEVVSLAQARSLSSRSFSSLTDELNLSGEMVINGKGIEIQASDDLITIQETINEADAGVSAQILTVDSGDSRLILTAAAVGEAGFDLRDASATNLVQALRFTSSETFVKNSFVSGARSSRFLDDDQAIGSLLNLGTPPAATITVGDEEVSLNLTVDSLNVIRDKINTAAPSGVTAQVVSSDDGGLTRYQLEIEGTSNLIDGSGVLATLGLLNIDGKIDDEIITGAESDKFTSTTTAVGSLLGLGTGPSGTVQIGGANVDIDLALDSLTDIQTKFDAAGIEGVTTSLISGSDDDGNAEFQLRIDGSTDLVDDGNVLESLGLLVGSNDAFESVAQVLTANATNQQIGALVNPTGNGAKADEVSSDTDTLDGLVGSSASGTIRVGDKAIAIDLATDSLNDVRDKINAAEPTGVTASVNVTGPSTYELEISGTTDFDDDNDILQTLGFLEAPSTMTAETRFADILGGGEAAGDTISIAGTNHDGAQVSGTFTISNTSLTVQNLLDTVEEIFGDAVTASVDGSGRIVVADNESGESSLALSLQANNEGDGTLNLGTLTETTQGIEAGSSELQSGQNAVFRINGITLSRSSNTVTDAVQGITLDLNDAEEGKLVNVTVTKDDTSELRGHIETFVADFNSTAGLIDQQFVVNEQQQGGRLSGDTTLMNLQSQLRSVVSSEIEGLEEGSNALVLMGIHFNRSGQLEIDNEALEDNLNNNLENLRKLFVAQGITSDSKVDFIASNKKTDSGNYSVTVSQAADKAWVDGEEDLAAGLEEDQTLTITDKATGIPAIIDLQAGDTISEIVTKINTELASDVAEVRRGTLANTTDGTDAIGSVTTFAEIFGAGVQDGDTIRINGTTHGGASVSSNFVIDDVNTKTVGDLLSTIRDIFDGQVSASVDSEGQIVITDNQVGPSSLSVTLVEENEGGGNLNFGSIDVEEEGRYTHEITASNENDKLRLEHGGFGSLNGFTLAQSINQLGLDDGDFDGLDVVGTINGEEADGFGRVLSGQSGSESVEGLSLLVTASASDVATSNDLGSVNLIYGVARKLSNTLDFITDAYDGILKSRTDGIDDTIDNLNDQIESMERRIELRRLNLVNKFAALEGSLSTLQSEGNFLQSQLAAMAP